ncbi:hypothetical protein [Hymenobacter persicinus]|uniref:Uncharacterized protein n=1 Tax=Hymenobacter persicinus TaxID=2025506 RepID=A0A4Q5LG46_9BACT|nr:hypothetical protein [Hymenobacter persicinus]RYU84421.1 hypothetical protein EWM57_01655 [Hymenobacter persicinus]
MESYLDFQAGGHNQPGCPVWLRGNVFQGFVNFFDCWYQAEVTIEDNAFCRDTNLLGAPMDIPVTFECSPLIRNNSGVLDRNTEDPPAANS